eukprot:scaffold87995_cov21-Tisochrysis_lutea.AAC.2
MAGTGGSDAEEHTMMGGMGHKQNSSSTPAAAAKGSDFRGGAQGATDGKAGKGEAGQGQGNDVGGGPEGVMGRKDRLKSRHFMCQAAYGFLGDVMCLSEGLRFMGPARGLGGGCLISLHAPNPRLCLRALRMLNAVLALSWLAAGCNIICCAWFASWLLGASWFAVRGLQAGCWVHHDSLQYICVTSLATKSERPGLASHRVDGIQAWCPTVFIGNKVRKTGSGLPQR